MSYSRWTLSACILLLLGVASVNHADEPQLLPRTGVLVLRNGRVLRGNILRVGDRYVVGLSQRDEVAVPVDSVEMRCDSLEQAYQQKRDLLGPSAKGADHLQLADWCLQYDLMAAAAEQLMAAQRCNPLDPANERFEKRLKLAVYRPSSPTPSNTLALPIASQAELDQLARTLPQGSMEQFTNTVQPLLSNCCGNSGCHGANSTSDFRLVFPNWTRTVPRRFTQRNLQNALQLLDPDEPDRSPLLVMATLAHGGAKNPALSEEDVTQLKHLADWIYRSVRSKTPSQPTVLKERDTLLLQPFDRRSAISPHARSSRFAPNEATRPDPLKNLIDTQVQPASHMEPNQTTRNPASFAPRRDVGVDPFDPEIFNRRFLKK